MYLLCMYFPALHLAISLLTYNLVISGNTLWLDLGYFFSAFWLDLHLISITIFFFVGILAN